MEQKGILSAHPCPDGSHSAWKEAVGIEWGNEESLSSNQWEMGDLHKSIVVSWLIYIKEESLA